jgi:hypothetical protein
MTLEYMGGQAPAPVKLTYKLEGSVSKHMLAGRGGGAPTEQVSKGQRWYPPPLKCCPTSR